MPHPSVPEWDGEELVYISPTAAVRYFGYDLAHERTPNELRHSQENANRVPLQDGEPNVTRRRFTGAAEATKEIKRFALENGADLVGVTRVDQKYVFQGEDVPHTHAITLALAMDFDDGFTDVPSAECNAEVLRVYNECSRVAVAVAMQIREWGYPARAHGSRKEQVAHIPHAYAAGLGELGKHGSLINPELGSMLRLATVTTDLPLVEDSPRDYGINDFCSKCQACVRHCPGDAIFLEKQEVRGVLKWLVDTEKCAPYWGSYYACAICLQVCPYNAKAFEGQIKQSFVSTMRNIDLKERRETLKADLQTPWTFVDRPTGDASR